MSFVTVRGVRHHVLDLPARDTAEGDAEPAVMLHGLFTGSAAAWYLMAVRVLTAQRPVRLIDWRGHGRSERPSSGYGARSLAADLAELTADLPPFSIVSHSYGGVAAIRFLLGWPERLHRLVLVDPPLDAGAKTVLAAADPTVQTGDGGPLRGSDPSLAWLTGELSPTAARKLDALVEETSIRTDLAVEPMLTDAELGAHPRVATTIIVGDASPFRSGADRLTAARPGTRAHTLPGGHDVHVTQAQAASALITAGLAAPTPAEATTVSAPAGLAG